MDTLQIRPTETRNIVLRSVQSKRPIFIWGPPGIGKSELVEDIVYNRLPGNNLMIDLRLALLEPTDLRGYPFRNPESNKMEWSPAEDLPDAETAAQYDNIVLFLDELNSAPPSVQSAAYQLVLNRRIGKYVLPDNVRIIAAGNRETDRGVTYRMPAPLANRFRHVNMMVNFDDWQNWAINKGVHHDVVGYLSYAKQDLFDFDPKTSSQAFATPRSWVYVSEMLENPGFGTSPDFEQKAEVAGAVGEGMAIKFCEHRKIASKLPRTEDVLSGKVTKLEIKELSAKYSFAVSLCYQLAEMDKSEEREVVDAALDKFFEFIMENFEPELVIFSAKTILADYGIQVNPKTLASKGEFKRRYWKYLFPEAA